MRFNRRRVFLLCIIIVLFSCIYFMFKFNEEYSFNQILIAATKSNEIENSQTKHQTKHSYIEKLTEKLACNPLSRSFTQYQVVLDGLIYPTENILQLHQNNSYNFTCLNSSRKIKKIFYWNTEFKNAKEFFRQAQCPVTNCELINDINRIDEASLVLVQGDENNLKKLNQILSDRRNQRFVLMWYESHGNFREFNGIFNMTSTYRLNSDFPGYYSIQSKMLWKENETFDDNFDFLRSKTQLAAALITNCYFTTSKRFHYIRQLKKHMPVNVYGNCGLSCISLLGNDANDTGSNCRDAIFQKFKFFLSFENSICTDYITEKFFLTLKHPIIPVVLGGGIYSRYVPKSGYIDALDFDTPKDLADYLIYLSNNKTAYNSYFKWKKYVSFDDVIKRDMEICDMCIKLNLEEFYGIEYKVINDFGSKLFNEKQECKIPVPNKKRFFNLKPLSFYYKLWSFLKTFSFI